MAVTFHFEHPVKLASRKKLKKLVRKIFSDEDVVLKDLNIIFCSDAYLLNINQVYLSHDYFTDIVTFNLGDDAGVAGEIYISVETANLNASKYKVLLNNELTRLVCHGCLHLCGYNDKKKSDKILMSAKENEYLFLFETL